MIITLDTTFFVLHYFSKEETVLSKTKRVLHFCRKLGNKGILPTIVLGEFYSLSHKTAGEDIAEKYFNEIVNSGMTIMELNIQISKQAAIIRRRYNEKIPWGDCIISATGLLNNTDIVLSEDPHFKGIDEIKARTLDEVKI